jgi:hypothetical protein
VGTDKLPILVIFLSSDTGQTMIDGTPIKQKQEGCFQITATSER